MIIFNGIDLASVADIKIEDINVGPIQESPVVSERAIRAGAEFVRGHKGIRSVVITFQVKEENQVVRSEYITNITAWAQSEKPAMLELPNHPDKYLMAYCTGFPDPSLRQWWQILRLTFTCFDPYWVSKAEKSASCGSDFVVLGDAPPMMKIERTVSGSAVSNQSYGLNGNTITFSSIPVGNMVIDLEKQTAVSGSTDIMQYYNVNSKFLVPKVGSQNVTGTGTVKWRERWA